MSTDEVTTAAAAAGVVQPEDGFRFDETSVPDALGDAERARESKESRNFARVGSQRPSSLLFTYGPGAIIDLPHFTVMTSGYRAMDRIYARRSTPSTINAPRLLETVQRWLGTEVRELRELPWAPKQTFGSTEGDDLGVDTIVFPQWMRCTGCDRLATVAAFEYRNVVPRRPDRAEFRHKACTGRPARGRTGRSTTGSRKPTDQPVVTARYLLACTAGHLDEFPYSWWVHEGVRCPSARDAPELALHDISTGGGNAVVECRSCGRTRTMAAARGQRAEGLLPRCRGRHPHLDGFDADCPQPVTLMLVGASNLWFPTVTSVVVMPSEMVEVREVDDVQRVADAFADDPDELADYLDQPRFLRRALREVVSVEGRGEDELVGLARAALDRMRPDDGAAADGVGEEDGSDPAPRWDPVDLLCPEWEYLRQDPAHERTEHETSGLTLSPRVESGAATPHVSRVLAVDKLRKVNALLGFTRLDDFDRVSDSASRLVRLDPTRPRWTLATSDQGEGIFLQLDEDRVAAWEHRVETSELWAAHRAAHATNFANRLSLTAGAADPDDRMPPPRYWLVHTFAHLLMRRMAMASGYGGASITERVYAWAGRAGRDPAAGVLVATTASDSDGTLGGLVRLSEVDRLPGLVSSALTEASRCSSDPVCALRVPRDGEDFLHGAACHCCTFLPETSCERGNRFLDRRLVVPLPGPYRDLAYAVSDG